VCSTCRGEFIFASQGRDVRIFGSVISYLSEKRCQDDFLGGFCFSTKRWQDVCLGKYKQTLFSNLRI
jgi:hypothetical protein